MSDRQCYMNIHGLIQSVSCRRSAVLHLCSDGSLAGLKDAIFGN